MLLHSNRSALVYIFIYIHSKIPIKALGGFGGPRALQRLWTRFLARSCLIRAKEAPEALRARFFAPLGAPGLDFGPLGRSPARFWKVKRFDF